MAGEVAYSVASSMNNLVHSSETAVFPLRIADGLVMGKVGRVCVAIWRKKSTRERFDIQRVTLNNVVNRYPGEAGFLCVVERTSEPPDDEYVRRASATMITVHGSKLACVGCVSEGSGFRAAITRSVMSGMMFLMRTPAPIRTFESVPSAAKWMAKQMPVGPMLEFIANIEMLRRLLETPRQQ